MPRFACAVVLASSALCPPAAADPLCYSVAFTGLPSQYVSPVSGCNPYGGPVICEIADPGIGGAGVIVVICRPAAPG
jgi:hypothetical protein